MKIIFAILIYMSFSEVHAQSCTDIRYTFEFKRSGNWAMKSRYIYNDSSAFFYFYLYGTRNPLKNATVFSKTLVHHAVFTEKHPGLSYDEVDYNNHQGLIKDTIKDEAWKATGISKKILNISCQGYLRVTATGDSILAYISNFLGDGRGLFHYTGLPGVALQIYDQSTGYYIVAKSIQKMDCSFQLPDAPLISRKENDAQVKNK